MRLRRTRSLTPARERQAADILTEWQSYSISTAPADRGTAERAIRRLYQLNGRTPPPIVWTESPVTAILAATALGYHRPNLPAGTRFVDLPDAEAWAGLADGFRESVRRSLFDTFGREATLTDWPGWQAELPDWQPGPQLGIEFRNVPATWPWHIGWESFTPSVGVPLLSFTPNYRDHGRVLERILWARLHLAVHPSLLYRLVEPYMSTAPSSYRRLLATAWRPLGDGVLPGPAWAQASQVFGTWAEQSVCDGQLDALRVGEHESFARLGLVRYPRRAAAVLDAHAAIARSCGFWWPLPGVCVAAERPVELHVVHDPRGEPIPHRADGPAVVFADGWELHAWRGLSVPREVIEGDLTGADWLGAPNVEVRRVISERLGYEWLLDQLDATRIAADEFGTLWRIADPDRTEPIVLVDVVNSTPEPDGTFKRYVLRVPPDQRVPRDAIGWTFGLAPGEYAPDLMT